MKSPTCPPPKLPFQLSEHPPTTHLVPRENPMNDLWTSVFSYFDYDPHKMLKKTLAVAFYKWKDSFICGKTG